MRSTDGPSRRHCCTRTAPPDARGAKQKPAVHVSLILNLKCAVNLKLYSYLWERNPHWRSPR